MSTTIVLENNYINDPLADVAALKSINTTDVRDGVICKVKTIGLFYLDKTSVEVSDDKDIITPTVGAGRWKRITLPFMTTNTPGNKISIDYVDMFLTRNSGTGKISPVTSSDYFEGYRFVSTVPTGTAPLSVASTTKVSNLNSELFSDKQVTEFLTGVSLGTPITNDILSFNGTSWTNIPFSLPASASSGVNFFLDDVTILPVNTENANEVNSLNHYPVTTTEVVDSVVVNNNTLFMEAYLFNTAIGGSQIDPGVWVFNVWAGVDNSDGISQILINTHRVIDTTGMTVTMTGPGTTRLATVTGGTPFISGDGSTNIANCSYLQTPKGLYAINAYSTPNEVTIAVPSGYVNEGGVSFKIWRKLFQVATGDINNISPNYQLFNMNTAQGSFAISSLDKLGSIFFGTTTRTSNTTISFTHNGNTRYSYFNSPLLTRHNDLAGLQGGTSGQYYHLASVAYGHLQNQDQPVYTSSNVTFASNTLSNLTASSLVGSDSLKKLVTINALPNGTTATTQSLGDSTTKVATTAFVANAVAIENVFDDNGGIILPVSLGSSLYMGQSATLMGLQFVSPPYNQDGSYFALLTTSLISDFGFGDLTINSVGGAAVTGGWLDLAHNDLRYIEIAALYNASFTQKGTIWFKHKPNYSGSPATNQCLISLNQNDGTTTNRIELYHNTDGHLRLVVTDYLGVNIINTDMGATWSPTAGASYTHQIDLDLATGNTKYWFNGTQKGSTLTAIGTRTNTCQVLRVGSNYNTALTSNFSINSLMVFPRIWELHPTSSFNLTNQYTSVATGYSSFSGPINVYGDITNSGSIINTGATTLTTGTYNSAAVAGIRNILCDTTGGNITINGLSGGVAGQELHIIKTANNNSVTITHSNASGTEKFLTWNKASQVLDANQYGGYKFYYNGTNWIQIWGDGT